MVVLFYIEVINEVEQDLILLQYFQIGKKIVQGIELGVIGDVISNLLLVVGYIWMDIKVNNGVIIMVVGENNFVYILK